VLAKGESIPLILLEEPGPFREDIRRAGGCPRLLASGPRRFVALRGESGGRPGVTARPVEMMSPDLRVAGISDGLPVLPDTRYVVSCNPQTVSELPQAIFQSLSQESDPWRAGPALTPEEGGTPSFCEVFC
jgi:hypothetical protein